jgi:hypothetical protein
MINNPDYVPEASITIHHDISYDENGMNVVTENKTNLTLDPKDKTRFIVNEITQPVEKPIQIKFNNNINQVNNIKK